MIEIKLDEAGSLTMNMKLDGDTNGEQPNLRFTVMSEGLRYSFEAEAKGDGEYRIAFPVMEGKIEPGEYDAQVEIVIGDKYFVPLQETVKFTKKVKPVVKLAEQMKALESAPTVSVKLGQVERAKPTKTISDIRGLVAEFNAQNEIDSDFALRALTALALKESVVIGGVKIAPKGNLSEAHAIAVLRLIRENGTDLETKEPIWEGVKNISEKAAGELRVVLVEKGVSARVLKSHGF